MRKSILTILLLAGLAAEARAATDPPLAPVLAVSGLRGRRHLALAVSGDQTPTAAAARAEVEAALRDADHDVVVLPAGRVSLPPDRATLEVAARYSADALVVVQLTPARGPDAIWVAAYDMSGAPLLAYCCRVLAPVVPLASVPSSPSSPAPGAIDLRLLASLDGPAFYRALGRPDLARRYEARRAGKVALRVGGGLLLIGGVVVGMFDAFAVGLGNVFNPSCVPGTGNGCQNASAVPWLVALAGVGMLIAPACYSTDPLTPSEKRALIDSVVAAPPRPSLSLTVAPAPVPGGGALFVAGRF